MHNWVATFLFRGKSRKLQTDGSLSRKRAEKQFKAIARTRRWKLIKLDRQRA